MTVAAVTADVRGYYANLGVTLPKSSAADVSVRCFAAPEAHRREDRKPVLLGVGPVRGVAVPWLRRSRWRV